VLDIDFQTPTTLDGFEAVANLSFVVAAAADSLA
jgi:hypothetical protein